MANAKKPVLHIDNIDQVCMVVRNLDKSMESMWETFGIGPWNIMTIGPDGFDEMTYHGKPAKFSFKMARTQNKIGGCEVELIEPLEGNSTYRDFLNEHGEGIHHIGWHRLDSAESVAEAVRSLEEAGFPCLMSARSSITAFAYVDTTKVLDTILELIWLSPVASSLPPARVFPE